MTVQVHLTDVRGATINGWCIRCERKSVDMQQIRWCEER